MTTGRLRAALLAGAALPMSVALVVLRSPRWHPLLDWAWIELRVRDVGFEHPPLLGLPGRLPGLGQIGSHLGPVAFYALAPVYRALGSSAWALLVSTAVLNLVAVAVSLWIAARRGGARIVLGVAAVHAMLLHAYAMDRIVVPWNPWLPMLWWIVFLLAVWSVVDDDVWMLPVAVFAGTFCVQTHISYLGNVLGLATAVSCLLAMRVWRRRDRSLVAPVVIAVAVGVALWLPVVAEQLGGGTGNLSIVRDHFQHPPAPVAGLASGWSIWLANLHPAHLLSGAQRMGGAPWGGLVVVVAEVGAAVAAVRWVRDRRLVALHATVLGALVLGLLSASRIVGVLWDYVVLWAWGTTAVTLLAMAWTAFALVGDRVPPRLITALPRAWSSS